MGGTGGGGTVKSSLLKVKTLTLRKIDANQGKDISMRKNIIKIDDDSNLDKNRLKDDYVAFVKKIILSISVRTLSGTRP